MREDGGLRGGSGNAERTRTFFFFFSFGWSMQKERLFNTGKKGEIKGEIKIGQLTECMLTYMAEVK